MVALRAGTVRDVASVAQLHCHSWRRTYRGLVPDSYLGHDLPGLMQGWWADKVPNMGHRHIFIVSDTGQIAGFVFAAVGRTPDTLLIDNLHVADAYQGRGIGRRLLRAMASQALNLDYKSAELYLIQGNDRALAFYEDRGGVAEPPVIQDIPGLGPVTEIPLYWQDLHRLL